LRAMWGSGHVARSRPVLLRCSAGRAQGGLAGCRGSPSMPNAMTDPRLQRLIDAQPGLRILTDAADLEHYGRDWTRRWTPAPLAIALPATVGEVQAVVRWANDEGVAIVPSGGRTGLSGGAVAANGELVLSLQRMNRVLGFDATD